MPENDKKEKKLESGKFWPANDPNQIPTIENP